MTWPFENDTSAITKKIAKNDIDKNRVKKVFSLTTIVFATALLMMLIMFESGYETTKDRMAEGQPQVVFYDLSQQQIELFLYKYISGLNVLNPLYLGKLQNRCIMQAFFAMLLRSTRVHARTIRADSLQPLMCA